MLAEICEGGFFSWGDDWDLNEDKVNQVGSWDGKKVERGFLSNDEKETLPRTHLLHHQIFNSALAKAKGSHSDDKINAKFEYGLTYHFGGEDGSRLEMKGRGEIQDQNGNKASLEITHDSTSGETGIGIYGSKEFEANNPLMNE